MSEIMTPIPFDRLIQWMLEEYRSQKSVFGIRQQKFYRNSSDNTIRILDTDISNPLGPAAGPNTQLAQNLVTSYVAGFRFMELKTVQMMDGEELRKCIPRPCINAEDEGYNCEWSTELTVQQAYEEYVKGWFAVHVAAKEFGISQKADFIFNMSVGYDFEGITSEKINTFIDDMKDASGTGVWKQCKQYLIANIDMFQTVTAEDIEAISPKISTSITLSTLHGCPAEEIEKIADYFLTVKHLHTYVKCNPTLLGYDFVRSTLNNLGYGYVVFDDRHFRQDLKFDDAVQLIERLQNTAKDEGLQFGVKVSNTFPVQIKNDELPGEFMYMSGRALFPLSINVASKLASHFNGKLPISYSGGADYFNVAELIQTGIKPVTVATTILKPGGYSRAKQLCEEVEPYLDAEGDTIDVQALKDLADSAVLDKHLLKQLREVKSRKTSSVLPLYDCFKAPCKQGGCPIKQQIPEYLQLVSRGKHDEAFKVIAVDNALPSITGEICNHVCQSKCTRIDYDQPLQIRNAKKIAAENAQQKYIDDIAITTIKTDKKAVVIGAGPAGIAAGLFLRRNGVEVTVLEKRDAPMGIVKYVIPDFRINQQVINLDYKMAVKTGVKFVFCADENYNIKELKKDYDFVIIATGAWKEGYCPVKQGGENLIDAIDFLQQSKLKECNVDLGKKVAVIGGGDVAMDCARAAKRAPGVEKVQIVYRRTKEFMPAEIEEQSLALLDGVKFVELLSPISYDGKILTVELMRLGERDTDGRRKVVPTGETITLEYDTVISAIGARVETAQFVKNSIGMDKNEYADLDENHQTNIDGVYIAGDCRQGAATIVQAMADSKKITKHILERCGIVHDFVQADITVGEEEIRGRKAVLKDATSGKEDCTRCLSCGEICEICYEVCPNRANVSIMVEGRPQIVHIDGMCNECGNCAVFCPYIGKPYTDKITLFWNRESFADSKNKGFMFTDLSTVLVRDEDSNEFECGIHDERISKELSAMIHAVKDDYSHLIM